MLSAPDKIRIDKWLWAIRLFKTRSLAAAACEKGKIKMAEQPVKASRMLKKGDVVSVRNGPFSQQYQVLQLTENRLAPKLVTEFCSNITPADELERILLYEMETRKAGTRREGRPSKKDRRKLDDYINF